MLDEQRSQTALDDRSTMAGGNSARENIGANQDMSHYDTSRNTIGITDRIT